MSTITRSQYHQLHGLLALAKRHNDALKEIEKAMYEITQEKNRDGTLCTPDDMGHTSDALYNAYSADQLMEKLKITIQ